MIDDQIVRRGTFFILEPMVVVEHDEYVFIRFNTLVLGQSFPRIKALLVPCQDDALKIWPVNGRGSAMISQIP